MNTKRAVATALALPARAYVRHAPTTWAKPLLVRRLLEPALRGRPRRFTARTVDGARVEGNTRDMIQRYLYVFGVWEPNLTAWLRRRPLAGRTVVDVGANIGYFSVLAGTLVGPQGRVVAIEAMPETFAQLERNVARNGLQERVRALSTAVGERHGRVPLFGGAAHNSGVTSTVATDGLRPVGEVPSAPLAALLSEHERRTARVIKIDVEGGEAAVIAGLLPVLEELPDDVELVVELAPPEQADGTSPATVVEQLAAHGFRPYRIENDYAPASYARRSPPQPPRRHQGPVTERTDLIFSRVDAETLP